jgi:hypothetical protein
MSLSKVGSATANEAYAIGAGGTCTLEFTPDAGTFEEGDVLIALASAGAIDTNQTFYASLYADEFTLDPETELGSDAVSPSDEYTSMHPNWWPVVHIVTAAEDGSSSIEVEATLNTVSTVDGVGTPGGVAAVGYIAFTYGIAVRGSEGPCTIKLYYAPSDSSDTDFSAVLSGTPRSGTFADVPAYDADWYSTSGGSVLFYVSSFIGSSTITAQSVVWGGGATGTGGVVLQNILEAGANDVDLIHSAAYTLVDEDDNWGPATISHGVTGATINFSPFRTLIVLDSAAGNTTPEYNQNRATLRQFEGTSLPYDVTSIDIIGGWDG